MSIKIITARPENIPALLPLFDAYRQFYKQPSDLDACEQYLRQRLEKNQATIYLALDENNAALGFALLYDTFTSVALGELSILNDLYVLPESRGQGVGTGLIAAAKQHAKSLGSFRLRLRTAKDNLVAQGLYDQTGFVQDKLYFTYDLVP